MPLDINFMIAGEAGQGVQSTGIILARVFSRGGYHVFADQDYESRVRGGHNFFRIRVKDSAAGAIREPVEVLIALNRESIELHRRELSAAGVVIYDGDNVKDIANSSHLYGMPLARLAAERAGNRIMANTVALGATLGILAYDFKLVKGVLRDYFGSGKTGAVNVSAAQAGYDYARENSGKFQLKVSPLSNTRRMLINGHEAVALGAIASGCRFMAGYPMTPATPIMEYLAAKAKDFDLAVVHTEDEIAAVNMAIGAAFTGVRAMTATSGSGFCLMTEGLGLAGITETPIVVVNAQRPGPATGLPSRTEQGDLEFMLHASNGEFPRAVLAPANVSDAFWLTVKAFNLADKYQTPVIVLTDHYLASSYATIDEFDLSNVIIDRGEVFREEDEAGIKEYQRHRITASGISPRAFPGQSEALVITDADEHDEVGHLIENAATRKAMVEKRRRKLNGLKKDISPPEIYGAGKAERTLIGWGSTCNPLCEAVDILDSQNLSVNALLVKEIWPFPTEAISDILGNTDISYVVESNASGQLARLIRAETGKEVSGKILKYDGRPFTPGEIVAKLKKERT